LLESCRPLPVYVPLSTSAGDRLVCLPGLEQRLEPWDAAAYDAQLDLDRRPQPYLEAVPCDIVRLPYNVADPVDTDTAGRDDDQAEAEERNDGDTLRERQLEMVEAWQRNHPDKEIEDRGDASMG